MARQTHRRSRRALATAPPSVHRQTRRLIPMTELLWRILSSLTGRLHPAMTTVTRMVHHKRLAVHLGAVLIKQVLKVTQRTRSPGIGIGYFLSISVVDRLARHWIRCIATPCPDQDTRVQIALALISILHSRVCQPSPFGPRRPLPMLDPALLSLSHYLIYIHRQHPLALIRYPRTHFLTHCPTQRQARLALNPSLPTRSLTPLRQRSSRKLQTSVLLLYKVTIPPDSFPSPRATKALLLNIWSQATLILPGHVGLILRLRSYITRHL